MDEALGHVVVDGQFWFFVKHQDEEFGLLRELLVFADVVEFGHQFAVAVVFLALGLHALQSALHLLVERVAVLLQVVLDLAFEGGASLFGFSADH